MAGMSMARSVRSARGQGSCGEGFERTYSVASPARRAPSMSHRPSLPTMMLRAVRGWAETPPDARPGALRFYAFWSAGPVEPRSTSVACSSRLLMGTPFIRLDRA